MKGLVFIVTAALCLCLAALLATGCGSSKQQCEDECSLGERRCVTGRDAFETCGSFDNDNCTEWGEQTECEDGQRCTAGTCGSGPSGLTLTGGLVPAGTAASGGGLSLAGQISRDFANQQSSGGSMTLEHTGFTSR